MAMLKPSWGHFRAILEPSWGHRGPSDMKISPKMTRRRPREPKIGQEGPKMAPEKPNIIPSRTPDPAENPHGPPGSRLGGLWHPRRPPGPLFIYISLKNAPHTCPNLRHFPEQESIPPSKNPYSRAKIHYPEQIFSLQNKNFIPPGKSTKFTSIDCVP